MLVDLLVLVTVLWAFVASPLMIVAPHVEKWRALRRGCCCKWRDFFHRPERIARHDACPLHSPQRK